MSNFPTIRSGSSCIYPVTQTSTYVTSVFQFVGDKEQRYISQTQQCVDSFELTFNGINGYDLSNLRIFWLGVAGASLSTFSFIFNGSTYNNLAFTSDSFNVTTSKRGQFNVKLNVKQIIPES